MTCTDLTVTGDQLREAVGTFPSDVTIVTTHDGEGAEVGMTVSAFTSLSLEPAMVMFSVANSSSSLPYLTVGAPIGISVLSDGQGGLARQFATRGIDRFAGVDTVQRGRGVSIIDASAAWFAGEISNAFPGGDHTIFTIAVEECDAAEGVRPLLYQQGRFHGWSEPGSSVWPLCALVAPHPPT